MILCAGEALIDMLPRESKNGELAFSPYAGGSVFNTAIALGRLGAPVGFFSGISTDLFGSLLTDALGASDVRFEFAARSQRPTTLAFVTLHEGHASYAFYDENTAGRMLVEEDLPTTRNVSALFFGGISLAVEPCATVYESLCAREAEAKVIMIDPNIRQSFIQDEDRYRSRIDRMISYADIVKVSDEDLAWIVGHNDLAKGANALLDSGPSLVCVTRGANGVSGFSQSSQVDVAAQTVDVVDTVGAGDTFNAGVLAAIENRNLLSKEGIANFSKEDISAALELGSRAAAVTVSRAGANPPTLAELQ